MDNNLKFKFDDSLEIHSYTKNKKTRMILTNANFSS